MGFLAWIVVGLIAGWLAGLVMKGGGYGMLVDIILGIPAGLWGGLSVGDLHFNLPQQRYDLLRLVFLHRHTSVPPE